MLLNRCCRLHLFAEELGGEVHKVASTAGAATTGVHLALEVHLHGHLASLLKDVLLAGVAGNLSVGALIVKELSTN